MVYEIGETAGKLWQYLAENPWSTLEGVAKSLKVKESLVVLAAGWLAREDKVTFEPNGKGFKLSLKSGE